MHKHILIPVDLGDAASSRGAAAVARHFAWRDGAQITALSVVPAWPDDLARTPRDYQPDIDAWVAEMRGDSDMRGEIRVGGSISGRIIEAIEAKKIDLVVMASHDPRITDYLIGSNAAHVVLHAPCSVLVVRGGGAARSYRNLLVPVDLDYPETSAKALDVAREMLRAEGAKLTTISVQPILIDETGAPPPDYQPKLDAFLAGPGAGAHGLLRLGGSISAEIRMAAEEIGADLIVMGSHDPHFTDYLIGSNAAHVALHSAQSVLVVR